jgi:hypothetical protein
MNQDLGPRHKESPVVDAVYTAVSEALPQHKTMPLGRVK